MKSAETWGKFVEERDYPIWNERRAVMGARDMGQSRVHGDGVRGNGWNEKSHRVILVGSTTLPTRRDTVAKERIDVLQLLLVPSLKYARPLLEG